MPCTKCTNDANTGDDDGAREHDVAQAKRAEFAGGEGIEGAEAGGEHGGGEAPFAVKTAEMVGGGAVALYRITIDTRRDEICKRVLPSLHVGNDVIETASASV